ncbi:MAG: TonB-dependent receptor [Parabacteroides sp.]|nr:TonB-dependent receptor [Parabacteroides sp.]
MKTIYNMKALCVMALIGSSMSIHAQEVKEEKKQELNREMTLEREYDPTVQDANKVNTLPVIKQPEAKKMSIDYATYTVPTDPEKEISLLPSGNIMTDIQHNKRRGYLNFGAGTSLNLNGDAGYHILNTEKDKLNLWFSHRSTNGKVQYIDSDLEKVKAKLNDNMGGLNFEHEFEKVILDMGIKYGYSAFNYYGLPLTNPTLSTPIADQLTTYDRETNQANQTIQANIGIESKEGSPIGYLLDLGYTNFSQKYAFASNIDGPTEQTFDVKFDLNARFGGEQRIGIGGYVEYFNYSLPLLNGTEFMEYKNHAEVALSPYYKVHGDNWKVRLGANVMFSTGEESKFMASPNIAADVKVGEKTELYLNAGGKMYSNSLYCLSRINRYASSLYELAPSLNYLDGKVGIRSGVAPGFWFDIFGGYQVTNNELFFVPSYSTDMNAFSYQSVLQANAKKAFGGVQLKYSYQQFLDFNLKGVYNAWSVSDIEEAFGKPKMEINAGITVHPIQKLTASLDYYLATGRKTYLGTTKGVQDMKNINELNLTGTYTFNETLGAYLKINNILCQKYELYSGYPMQSFSAMIGVNFNF